MPTAIVYTIRPQAAASVPSSLGRATHAAILRLIQAADPALAARLHDDEGVKPLTVSNVQGLGPGRFSQARPERDYTMRVTLLTPELEAIAAQWTPEAIGALDLDGHGWQVLARADAPAANDWAGVELVFGSLLEKWNAFAPIALPDEVRRFAEERLAVSRYELRTLAGPTSGGALQIGAVGRCTYVAVGHDRYWQACVTTLARFARYAGIGAGAARGFGQARLLDG
jgi:CRISPR-associated endoribonuclease Cas6